MQRLAACVGDWGERNIPLHDAAGPMKINGSISSARTMLPHAHTFLTCSLRSQSYQQALTLLVHLDLGLAETPAISLV
jgi:hypothetical protein